MDHFISRAEQEMMCGLFDRYERQVMGNLDNKDITDNIDYLLRKYT